MEKITGRSDDMMILRGVNVFPTQIEEELLKIDSLSAHYQIVLTREGRLDEMEIMVEARPHAASAKERTEAARKLKDAVKSFIGVTAKVTVATPGAIERSLGKAKRVLDKRVASSE
jgi:phenylacetate-CoA ligase